MLFNQSIQDVAIRNISEPFSYFSTCFPLSHPWGIQSGVINQILCLTLQIKATILRH